MTSKREETILCPNCKYRTTVEALGNDLCPECGKHGVGFFHRPPTIEPAESEGKESRECPAEMEGKHWWAEPVYPSKKCQCGLMWKDRFAPTAPPAESVEDALECLKGFGIRLAVEAKSTATKSLRARQCEIRSKAIFTVLDAFKTLESEREQYATKQIERQTPAIIKRFVKEVEKELMPMGFSVHLTMMLTAAMREIAGRREK